MRAQPVERKLAAIFAADIAGYSRLMARDELGTSAGLRAASKHRVNHAAATLGAVDSFKAAM